MKYYFIIQILALVQSKKEEPLPNLKITLNGDVVYNETHLQHKFSMDAQPQMSCTPFDLTVFKQIKSIPLRIKNHERTPIQLIGLRNQPYENHQTIQSTIDYYDYQVIQPNQSVLAYINHQCDTKHTTKANYWSIEQATIQFQHYKPIQFEYQFICDPLYHPNRFDWSNIWLAIFASISILFLARFGKIYSFKIIFRTKPRTTRDPGLLKEDDHIFQGFFLSLWHSLAYIVFLTGALTLSLIFKEHVEIIEERIVIVIIALATFMFFNEVFHKKLIQQYKLLCLIKFMKQKVVWKIRICDIMSVPLSLSLIAMYLVADKNWLLSDLLTICLLGTLVKMFKILSLKDSLYFFIPCLILDIVASIYLAIFVRYVEYSFFFLKTFYFQEWDSTFIKYFNTPLSAQIPYLHCIYKKRCGWISIFNILFPGIFCANYKKNFVGFFLGFAYRFDHSKKTNVYQIISFLGLLLGMITWLILQSVYAIPLPVALFTEVPMVGFCALCAYQRHEIYYFWTGFFYDQILLAQKTMKVSSRGSSIHSIRVLGNKQQQDIEMSQLVPPSQGLVQITQSGRMDLHQDLFEGLLIDNKQL